MSTDPALLSAKSGPLTGMLLPFRWALTGAAASGIVGGAIGGLIGWSAYPPTAWFAVFEIGIPATILGAWGGLAVGLFGSLVRLVLRIGDVEASVRSRRSDTALAIVVTASTVLILVALRWLGWVALHFGPHRKTIGGGPVPALGATSVVSAAVAVLVVLTHRRWARWLLVVAAFATMITAMTVATSRQHAASAGVDQALRSAGGGVVTTSYAIGAAVGVGAALVMVVSAVAAVVAAWGRRSRKVAGALRSPAAG